MSAAKQQLEEANAALSLAALALGNCRETFEQFMRESERMDSVGPIIDPTLWNSSERRATEAILKPIYKAALDFLRAHDMTLAAARDALEKVQS